MNDSCQQNMINQAGTAGDQTRFIYGNNVLTSIHWFPKRTLHKCPNVLHIKVFSLHYMISVPLKLIPQICFAEDTLQFLVILYLQLFHLL